MVLIADLHIHGPYAQACSKNTTIELLEQNAKVKGLDLLGTGDCFHPKWFDLINEKLTEDENGILWTKNKFPFLWQTEISLMYTHGGKGRRIHHIILMPNKGVVVQVRDELLKRGRLDYDGRPIFGINSIEFVDMLRSISKDIELIPAHAWTSWMSVFGSKSGFDSVEECFEDRAKYIHALETGLSSDPLMNRRVSSIDKYNLVSFSDAHSYHPWRIGREATLFDCKINYKEILKAIRTGEGLKGTLEVEPAYGKYHFDGHRACGVSFSPEQTEKLGGICPKCKKPLTIGVDYRVEQLADREEPINVPPFKKILPLIELIASVQGIKLLSSKKVQAMYFDLIKNFKNEYNILLDADIAELRNFAPAKLVDMIALNRRDMLKVKPGFDGVYGEFILEAKDPEKKPQSSLSEF